MSLYYSDDLVTLHLGDCLTETAWLGADVLVTDPPYGMGYQSSRRGRKLDKVLGDRDTAARDSTISLWGTRPALVFGRWSVAAPDGEVARLIWWKSATPGMGNLALPWGPTRPRSRST